MENKGNCQISWQKVRLYGTEHTIYIDVTIDGVLHRFNEHDLYPTLWYSGNRF